MVHSFSHVLEHYVEWLLEHNVDGFLTGIRNFDADGWEIIDANWFWDDWFELLDRRGLTDRLIQTDWHFC